VAKPLTEVILEYFQAQADKLNNTELQAAGIFKPSATRSHVVGATPKHPSRKLLMFNPQGESFSETIKRERTSQALLAR
jgi:hypothetical protein